MSQQVTITSVTANTPVNIFYCDSFGANCVYVSTVSVFPFFFDVPPPYDETNIVIKIEDVNGCIDEETVFVTPTPTSNVTPTVTQTPTVTTTPTNTPSYTPTTTPTITVTSTVSSTVTPTPSATPVLTYIPKGQNTYTLSGTACGDIITSTNYYTYLNEASSIPVVGVKVYTTQVDGVLYNPFNGENLYIKMFWNGNNYAVRIDNLGTIIDFTFCS